MDIRKLQRAIVDGLEDVKAHDIRVFNTEHLSPLFERVIIASGTSNRQTKALASSVRETVKKRGMRVMSTEGEDNGEWIIVDCGAAVAHIMQPAIRDYYHLEELWGGKTVRMKMDGPGARSAAGNGAAPIDDREPSPPPRPRARKTDAASAAPRARVPAASAPTKTPSRTAGKSAGKTARPSKSTASRTAAAPGSARRRGA